MRDASSATCIGKYHPHGDIAIYDALVRMAQPFSLRVPLVDGHGNFGSLDGDSPAAYRYTEARLHAARDRAARRRSGRRPSSCGPNYDGTHDEPVVLPARFPNLLVNGAQGIAVGMATTHPAAQPRRGASTRAIALIDDRDARRGSAQVHQGAGLPDRRPAPRRQAASCARSTRPARARSSSAASGRSRTGARGAADDRRHVDPVRAGRRQLVVEKIADVILERKLPHARRRARRVDRRRAHRRSRSSGRPTRRSSWPTSTSTRRSRRPCR